jgi:hypothetical protein
MSRKFSIGWTTAALVAIAAVWTSTHKAKDDATAPATDAPRAQDAAGAPEASSEAAVEAGGESAVALRAEPSTLQAALSGEAPAAAAAVTTTAGGYTFRPGTDERMPRHSGVSELRRLSRKAVQRAAERERERALLEDREVLEYARRIYEYDGAVAGTDTGTVVRAAQLEVLAAALAIPGNPQREFLRQTLAELAVRRVHPRALTEESRQEIATDRVVLFQLLRKNFPETAQMLRAEVGDERLAKLLDYAASLPLDDREGA